MIEHNGQDNSKYYIYARLEKKIETPGRNFHKVVWDYAYLVSDNPNAYIFSKCSEKARHYTLYSAAYETASRLNANKPTVTLDDVYGYKITHVCEPGRIHNINGENVEDMDLLIMPNE